MTDNLNPDYLPDLRLGKRDNDTMVAVTPEALEALAVKVLHNYRKRDGLTCYNYHHNRLRDERYMRETFAELVAPFIARHQSGRTGAGEEVEKLLTLIETAHEHANEIWIVEQAARVRAALSQDTGAGEALREALAKIMPITFDNGPDYMSLYFGDGSGAHSTQAMTMHPQDWYDLQTAYEAVAR